jgi:hypothetical protein
LAKNLAKTKTFVKTKIFAKTFAKTKTKAFFAKSKKKFRKNTYRWSVIPLPAEYRISGRAMERLVNEFGSPELHGQCSL